jgi:hypothetical protein
MEISATKYKYIATFKRCLHCGDHRSKLELFKIAKKHFYFFKMHKLRAIITVV